MEVTVKYYIILSYFKVGALHHRNISLVHRECKLSDRTSSAQKRTNFVIYVEGHKKEHPGRVYLNFFHLRETYIKKRKQKKITIPSKCFVTSIT